MNTDPEITESEITTPPDFWMDDYTDEDGEFIPGHMVHMSQIRTQTFETRCPECRTAHCRRMEVSVLVVEYPELYQRAREVMHDGLRTDLATCQGCRLLEQARETRQRAAGLFAGGALPARPTLKPRPVQGW